MRFQDIVPQLAAGVNFRQANWTRDTYITLGKDGYIHFIFRGQVDDKHYTPNLTSAFDADWISMENKRHVDVEQSWAHLNLFHLLETAGAAEFCVKSENITESVDIAFFDSRGALTFQNFSGELCPCLPGIEMFTKTTWTVAPIESVAPTPVPVPAPAPELVQEPELVQDLTPTPEPVLEHTNRSTTEPEVLAPEGLPIQIQQTFYRSGKVFGRVVSQAGDMLTMETLTGVHGSRELSRISINLFELLFEPVEWFSVGAVLMNNETGVRVTIVNNEGEAVLGNIYVTAQISTSVTIPKDELNSVNWALVDFNPQ